MIMADAKTKTKAAKKPAEKKAEAKKPAEKKPETKKPAEKKAQEKKPQTKEDAKPKHEAAKEEAKKEAKPKAQPKSPPKTKEAKKPEEKKKEFPIAKIQYTAKPATKKLSKTKPKFRRQEAGRYKRLEEKWRRPTGIDSKKLEKQRGKGLLPSIGYKKPASESGLHAGFEAVRVFNPDELKKINPDKQVAVIAAAVGRRKRNIIIDAANKLKITILNPRRGEI
jgi:large subunit ribosomal protein L32e